MAKEIIDIGTTANDGTGDQLREAFNKTNLNFTELYDADTAINAGTGTVVNTTVPAAAIGQAGDTAGMIAADAGFIYVCHTTYTDGLSDIWSRVAVATWV